MVVGHHHAKGHAGRRLMGQRPQSGSYFAESSHHSAERSISRLYATASAQSESQVHVASDRRLGQTARTVAANTPAGVVSKSARVAGRSPQTAGGPSCRNSSSRTNAGSGVVASRDAVTSAESCSWCKAVACSRPERPAFDPARQSTASALGKTPSARVGGLCDWQALMRLGSSLKGPTARLGHARRRDATRRLPGVRRSRAKLTPQSRGSLATTIRPAKRPGAARELFRSTQILEGLLSPQAQATEDEALAPERVGPWLILVTDVRGVYSRGRHSRAAAHLDAVGGEPEFLGRVGRCSGCSGGIKPDREPVS